ncbi:MAG: sulfatase-like hydrolase/transferase, partial [Anaerolineales bacterium]|nr:sulfatase-like hydrolase/transferase [Anaerolineales bacterium]
MAATLSASRPALRRNQPKPNVVVFFTDQQRWDTAGLHGNPLDRTPNLDRMALRGTHLHNSFTCQPVCGPSRACLQTGLDATATGCYRNGIPLAPNFRTLAHYFSAAGYDTGYIGKWHLADGIQPVPVAQQGGYEYWLAANILEAVSYPYDTLLFDNHGCPVALPGYRVDGPGFEGGRRLQELVSIVDLTPTLLDAAGVHVPEGLHGRSIMPLVRGQRVAWPSEILIQISES